MSRVRVGVIGLGMMGRHHARVAQSTDGVDFVGAADPNGDVHGVVHAGSVFSTVDSLAGAGIDAAVIAVPTYLHSDIAGELVERGVDILVEKPVAESAAQGQAMAHVVADRELVGVVGHVERCNPALIAMTEKLSEGVIGRVFAISTTRIGPFPNRVKDVGVVKDLATHDIDIVRWIAGTDLGNVSCSLARFMGGEHEDLVRVAGETASGVVVSMDVNWLSPRKQRSVTVLGEGGALHADLLMADLTLYRNGDTVSDWQDAARLRGVSEGDATTFAIAKREPLRTQLERFRDAVQTRALGDLLSIENGVAVLADAERILASYTADQRGAVEDGLGPES